VGGCEHDRWTLRIAMNQTAIRWGIQSSCPWPCLLRGLKMTKGAVYQSKYCVIRSARRHLDALDP
jgi:hypothetical protein